MEPLLKTIAREYTKRYSDLKSICFLFPNKRCGIFLKKYFSEFDIHTEDLPHILTISEFMSQVSRKTEAERIEQLFTLFNSYKEILDDRNGGEIIGPEFDTFRRWGETVLGDFNTVDINLVDSDEIFKSIKDFREISSNFLSEEQKEVMKEYFGIEDFSDSSKFWKTFDDPDNISPLKQNFINLWQILGPLHKKFICVLEKKGLGTTGSIFKSASGRIELKGRDALPYKKIVAIGFNALSESERTVFKRLKAETGYQGFDDFIDFIWDITGPILSDKKFTASRFVSYNLDHFPSPEWLAPVLSRNEINEFPQINIISAPSNTSQTKIAGKILKDYYSEKKEKEILDADVALVLPDETLLPNMLYSLPDEIEAINLTMGVSLKNSSIASFLSILKRLYISLRESKDSKIFYVKDLKRIFSHPYAFYLFDTENIEKLMDFLDKNHKISVSLSQIKDYLPNAESLFKFPLKKAKGYDIFNYLDSLFEALKAHIIKVEENANEIQEFLQIKIFQEYVKGLEETMIEFKIDSLPISVFQMVERLISAEKIGFEGEPLMGLQVMGTLETRSLDFRHIIILSMNEGIMPRKSVASTFIPESLRKVYGLPPARYAEEIFGYYFYRLISRAETVTLIYDGRTISGMRGGESRYLLQLKQYVPENKIEVQSWNFELQNRKTSKISIKKDNDIKDRIKAFSEEGDSRKNLSASSLNTYRECEIRFFLQNILNINSDPERGEFIDSISIGDILHEVMMELYMPENLCHKLLAYPLVLDKMKLKAILKSPDLIRSLILKNIEKIYYGRKKSEGKIESGVTEIIATQIEELVRNIVKYDLSLAPFKLFGCEIKRTLRVKLSSGRTVNFTFAIDRFDEIEFNGEKRLRIVDYKTGQRKRKAKDLEEVFKGGYESEQIFQLFTYAWLLGKLGYKGWEDVMTEIYFVPDLLKGEGGLPEVNGEKVTSFKGFYEEFNERLTDMVENIFISETFNQSDDSASCTYCSFKSFCSK